ncbi:MAG: hypothetical protein ACJA08_003112 [Cyclobacteriaceae bacterium]|jgi:uncharacterized protein YggE
MKIIKLLPIIAFLILNQAEAQTRKIEITGNGEMKIAPDQGILQINIRAHQMSFGEAITALGKKEENVLKKMEKLGYKKENVRTSNFSVNENIIWRNGTRYDSGYIASQYMTIEFPNAKERIAKILNAFSEGKMDAEISFGFKLSDNLKNEMNAKVIELAVNDARKNADLLAKFTGMTIKSVLKIEYHINQNVGGPVYGRMEMGDYNVAQFKSTGESQGFEAQDIPLSDQVTIHYEIE